MLSLEGLRSSGVKCGKQIIQAVVRRSYGGHMTHDRDFLDQLRRIEVDIADAEDEVTVSLAAPAECGCARRHAQLGVDIWRPTEDAAEQFVLKVTVDEGALPEDSLNDILPTFRRWLFEHGIGDGQVEGTEPGDPQPYVSATFQADEWR